MTPTIGISSSVCVTIAKETTAPPNANEPMSPMKILAGYLLNIKKPHKPPIIATA